MNGRQFFSKRAILKNLDRRSFLLRAGVLSSLIVLDSCIKKLRPGKSDYAGIPGKLGGPNATAGHILRDKLPVPKPSLKREVRTLIIGGGISGLSAARWLSKHGYNDFELLELETHVGGNSRFGENSVSKYPLGAHYVTLANNHDSHLTDFFKECNVITHLENGLPFYNEYYLCFDPEERLLINGYWQEGLIPQFGVPDPDRKQIKDFMQLVEQLKDARGSDGKFAFDIPIDHSSADPQFRALDQLPFSDYLSQNGFTSKYLLWYLEYCCKDDYGRKIKDISAWAGLHYFSSRKGKAANAEANAVLTWPEGNGWLMEQLRKDVKSQIRPASMACSIAEAASGRFEVLVYDLAKKSSYIISSETLILASPQFVNKKLLPAGLRPNLDYDDFTYSPWVIANITLNEAPVSGGTRMCWDNVAYNTPSVGYVNAGQQSVDSINGEHVITYYLPLCDHSPRVSRLAAYSRTYEQWLDLIVPELEYMHPGIRPMIKNIEIWVWGHGMIAPEPGFIWGKSRKAANTPIGNKIFFAHTDLSGISIFEEAFHQGIKAAEALMSANGK